MPRPKVTAPIRIMYHPSASCRVEACTWQQSPSQATRELAKRHTLNTGHDTEVVVEDVTVYRREEAS